MGGVTKLIEEIHGRSVWQVLLTYLVGSWAALEVVGGISDTAGLPDWVPPFALVLLVIGLPIVVATAVVQKGAPGATRSTDTPRDEPSEAPTLGESTSSLANHANTTSQFGRLFTWRNAIFGGFGAFALLGLTVVAYFIMWTTGIGPIGSLEAQGVFDDNDQVILAEFENESDDARMASVVTQALRTDLEQSPVITLLPEAYLEDVLSRMGRSAGEPLSPAVAREAAVREGIKAVIEGEIGSVGSSYVLTARIVDPQEGAPLASFRETAASADEVITALDQLSQDIREKAGESLRSIKSGPPLDAVTTRSLDALRKYAEGIEMEGAGDYLAAITLLEEAIEADSAFAMAYRKLAVVYDITSQDSASAANSEAAFRLRDRLTDVESHLATAWYWDAHPDSQDTQTAMREYEAVLRLAPDNAVALNNLARTYGRLERYEESAELLTRAVSGPGRSSVAYENLINRHLDMGNPAEADRAHLDYTEHYPPQPRIDLAGARIAAALGDATRTDSMASLVLSSDLATPANRRFVLQLQGDADFRRGRMRAAADHYREAAEMAAADGASSEFRYRYSRAVAVALVDTTMALSLFGEVMDSREARSDEPLPRLDDIELRRSLMMSMPDGVEYFEANPPELQRWALDEMDDLLAEGLDPDTMSFLPPPVLLQRASMGDSTVLEVVTRQRRELDCRYCSREREADSLRLLGRRAEEARVWEDVLTKPASSSGRSLAGAPLQHRRAARAWEAAGDLERAAEHYDSFADMWVDADPELQPQVSAAREKALTLRGAGQLLPTPGGAPGPSER